MYSIHVLSCSQKQVYFVFASTCTCVGVTIQKYTCTKYAHVHACTMIVLYTPIFTLQRCPLQDTLYSSSCGSAEKVAFKSFSTPTPIRANQVRSSFRCLHLYCIAGNISGELYLADWWISCHTTNIKSANIA